MLSISALSLLTPSPGPGMAASTARYTPDHQSNGPCEAGYGLRMMDRSVAAYRSAQHLSRDRGDTAVIHTVRQQAQRAVAMRQQAQRVDVDGKHLPPEA